MFVKAIEQSDPERSTINFIKKIVSKKKRTWRLM